MTELGAGEYLSPVINKNIPPGFTVDSVSEADAYAFLDTLEANGTPADTVSMGELRWSQGPLVTYGVGPCLFLLFVPSEKSSLPKTTEQGFGHLPYQNPDPSDPEQSGLLFTEKIQRQLEKARDRLLESNAANWHVLIFAGRPTKDTPVARRLAARNKQSVISLFQGSGIACFDNTNSDPNVNVEMFIYDPRHKKIKLNEGPKERVIISKK